jgi:hypothetical protein
MQLEDQLDIMRTQLQVFDTVLEKISYLHGFFDPDPEFTQEARDIIRGEICHEIKQNATPKEPE